MSKHHHQPSLASARSCTISQWPCKEASYKAFPTTHLGIAEVVSSSALASTKDLSVDATADGANALGQLKPEMAEPSHRWIMMDRLG